MPKEDQQDLERIDRNLVAQPAGADVRWYDARSLPLEGAGWDDTKGPYDRLPARVEGRVRPIVWEIGQHSAGLSVRFVTDATDISARWSLRSDRLAMSHMPATGVSGVDLYGRFGGNWLWAGVGKPENFPTNESLLAGGLAPGKREYLLYLPLYNGATSVEIGVPHGSIFEPAATSTYKPVVFYGSSIVQGGCASRPGLAYPSIVARRLDMPAINLGFSGNAHLEPELARLLAELDPSMYVLDPLPNNTHENLAERIEPFMDILRGARPTTPIVLVENLTYDPEDLFPARKDAHERINALLGETYEKRFADGDANLHYIPAAGLLGTDRESTVDQAHPTTAGFLRLADGMEPILRDILRSHVSS